MRRAGIGADRIASELGVSKVLVTELLRGEPPPASLMRIRAKDDLREAAIALREQGRTYDEIQAELGVSKGSLSLWLRHLPHPTDEERADAASGGAQVPLAQAPPDRQVARQLREDGWLLREIAEELGVSPKTAFVWTTGIPVPGRATHGRSAEETRAMNRARWDRVLAEREAERQANYATATARVGRLSERDLDLLVATAYWCEGAKSKPWARREKLTFINSDPDLIRLFLTWLDRRGVVVARCRLSVNIHASADVEAATAYWAAVVGCPVEEFAKPLIKRHNPVTVRKNVGQDYRGCLSIGVRQSRLLYQEIEGLWRGIVEGLPLVHGAD